MRPSQRACSSQPVVTAAATAPADTAAYSSPVPAAPAWNTVSDRTANSARGIPNAIAARSIAKEPSSARLPRTNRRPSRIERPIGSCSSPRVGGSDRIGSVSANITANATASTT